MIRQKHSGFSFVELLLVVVILSIICVFVAPAAVSIVRGNRLSRGAQTIEDQLTLARELALAKNRPIEVRLYRFADPETPGSTTSFRAIQIFEVRNARTLSPLQKIQQMPATIIADASPVLSSLLDSARRPLRTNADTAPIAGVHYQYAAFRFRPDGSTDLSPAAESWYVSLHDEKHGDSLAQPPPNFVTIEIDAVSGGLRSFRPGV